MRCQRTSRGNRKKPASSLTGAAIVESDMKQWEAEVCAAFWKGQSPVNEFPDVNEWPVNLQPLVAEFGCRAVWDASEAVHGFPPTWCRGAGEAFAVEKFLKSRVPVS